MSAIAQPASLIQIPGGTFDPVLHQYRNTEGIVRPSTTQILEGVGLVNYDDVPGDTLKHKRDIGDAAHFATHSLDICRFCQGILLPDETCTKCKKHCEEGSLNWDDVNSEVSPYILAYQRAKKESGMVVEEAEVSGIGKINGMEFGYTRDRIITMPGIKYRAVLELKCAYKEEKSWKWQTASYERTCPKKENEHIARIGLQLKKDTSFKFYIYEDPRDIDVFTWALALTWTKINAGLPWQKESL